MGPATSYGSVPVEGDMAVHDAFEMHVRDCLRHLRHHCRRLRRKRRKKHIKTHIHAHTSAGAGRTKTTAKREKSEGTERHANQARARKQEPMHYGEAWGMSG